MCYLKSFFITLTLVSLRRNAMNCFEISSSTLVIKTVLLLMFSCPRNTHVLCANLRREFNDSLVSNNCSNQLWPILVRFFQNYKFLILEICMKGRTLFFRVSWQHWATIAKLSEKSKFSSSLTFLQNYKADRDTKWFREAALSIPSMK